LIGLAMDHATEMDGAKGEEMETVIVILMEKI